MSEKFESLYGDYLGKTGNSTKIVECTRFLSRYAKESGWFTGDYDVQDEFLEFYPKWIESSETVKITGLETFPHRYVSLGATQSLDWFHYECAIANRTLRMFRGEYPYHRDSYAWNWDNFIDDRPLEIGDAVVLSIPFSATGEVHPRYEEIMETCNKLNIPVLIDCAWFGTCYDLSWSLDYDCIKLVTFSTTKGLQTGQWRSGICFSKWKHGPLALQCEWHHGIHANIFAGLMLMKEFSPDNCANIYKDHQTTVCDYFGLTPSHTIHIAHGNYEWNEFHRDKTTNRINIKQPLLDLRNGVFYQKMKEKLG